MPCGFCNFRVLEKPHCLSDQRGTENRATGRLFQSLRPPCLPSSLSLIVKLHAWALNHLLSKRFPRRPLFIIFMLFISKMRKLKLQEAGRYKVADPGAEPRPAWPQMSHCFHQVGAVFLSRAVVKSPHQEGLTARASDSRMDRKSMVAASDRCIGVAAHEIWVCQNWAGLPPMQNDF